MEFKREHGWHGQSVDLKALGETGRKKIQNQKHIASGEVYDCLKLTLYWKFLVATFI